MLRFPDRVLSPCRVFCIGRNYGDHIREMKSDPADSCVIFMKPYTSLVPVGRPVRLPRRRGSIHHEMELVVAIGEEGKQIDRDEALEHVAGITLGLDLTLRDVQEEIKRRGRPWEECKSFDDSAPLGDFVPLKPDLDLADIQMRCTVNGETRQEGHTGQMIHSVDRLIEILSRTWRLLEGDLIFTGTPSGVGPVRPGDTVTLESPQIGTFTWEMIENSSPAGRLGRSR